LGGKAALSLCAVPEPDQPAGIGNLELDWRALLEAAGFDETEIVMLVANKLLLVPRGKLPEYLGLPNSETERLRKRMVRKLRILRDAPLDVPEAATILRVDSSGTCRLIRFWAGGLTWEHF
jgi:hypothetical protein